jgi:hypothetical protein
VASQFLIVVRLALPAAMVTAQVLHLEWGNLPVARGRSTPPASLLVAQELREAPGAVPALVPVPVSVDLALVVLAEGVPEQAVLHRRQKQDCAPRAEVRGHAAVASNIQRRRKAR